MVIDAVGKNERNKVHHYKVEVRTDLGEKEAASGGWGIHGTTELGNYGS